MCAECEAGGGYLECVGGGGRRQCAKWILKVNIVAYKVGNIDNLERRSSPFSTFRQARYANIDQTVLCSMPLRNHTQQSSLKYHTRKTTRKSGKETKDNTEEIGTEENQRNETGLLHRGGRMDGGILDANSNTKDYRTESIYAWSRSLSTSHFRIDQLHLQMILPARFWS